jgi:hypothetical protein
VALLSRQGVLVLLLHATFLLLLPKRQHLACHPFLLVALLVVVVAVDP